MALFQSSSKKVASSNATIPPALKSASAAEQWIKELQGSSGAQMCERVVELLQGVPLVDNPQSIDLGRLEAVLKLNALTQAAHNANCTQYLMQAYLPRELESKLRNRILDYAYAFQQAFAAFSGKVTQKQSASHSEVFALAFSRQLFYLCEVARWQMFRYFMPDEQFWKQVNAVYRQAEVLAIETVPVFLFAEQENATTVQDQFLILMMIGQLSGGNLTARQINMAYLLLRRLSSHVEVQSEDDVSASFVVDLHGSMPAARVSGKKIESNEHTSLRFWDTTDLVITISDWSIEIDAGRMPEELKGEFYVIPDAEFLRFLCREWAPQPVQMTRSERFVVHDKKITVIHHLPVIHQQIRLQAACASSEQPAELRVYGGQSSSQLAADSIAKVQTHTWVVRDESETGLGIQIEPKDAEWLNINTLFAFREKDTDPWALALVRRIRRFSEQDVFIGAGRLSDQVLPVSLFYPGGTMPDTTLPPEWNWIGGQIALFAPIKQHKKVVSGLFMPMSLYAPERKFMMSARGKSFTIVLSRVLERGRDWCLVEVKRTDGGSQA